MNDETKVAADAALVESMVQQLRDCVSVGDEMTLDHASLIDDAADWIAGEPARLAVARDDAAEEMVEACAVEFHAALREGRAVVLPNLHATPRVRYWTDLAQAEARDAAALRARVAELEADRERLEAAEESTLKQVAAEYRGRITAEAQVAEAHERLDEFGIRRDGESATLVEGIAAMRERIDEYRAEWYRAEAQVAAARAECEKVISLSKSNHASDELAALWQHYAANAADVLRAMDEAAK